MGFFDRSQSDHETEVLVKRQKELEYEIANLQQQLDLKTQQYKLDLKEKEHALELSRKAFEHEKLMWKKEQDVTVSNMKGQLLLKYEQDMERVRATAQKELVDEKEKLNAGFYKKMTDSLSDLHTKGNHTTEFMQQIALKMLDKHPSHTKLQIGHAEE